MKGVFSKIFSPRGFVVIGALMVIVAVSLICLCLAEGGENLWVTWRAFVAIPFGLWLIFKGLADLKMEKDTEITRLKVVEDNADKH